MKKSVIIIIDIIFIVLIILLKAHYYAATAWGALGAETRIVWMAISFALSLSPAVAQVTLLKNAKISVITSGILLLVNLGFETISLFGSAMSLDARWTHMALLMLVIHLAFIIPTALIYSSNKKEVKS